MFRIFFKNNSCILQEPTLGCSLTCERKLLIKINNPIHQHDYCFTSDCYVDCRHLILEDVMRWWRTLLFLNFWVSDRLNISADFHKSSINHNNSLLVLVNYFTIFENVQVSFFSSWLNILFICLWVFFVMIDHSFHLPLFFFCHDWSFFSFDFVFLIFLL